MTYTEATMRARYGGKVRLPDWNAETVVRCNLAGALLLESLNGHRCPYEPSPSFGADPAEVDRVDWEIA